MHTKCPDCKTRFRVNDDQLRVAQGQVRCSRCHIIFNAREYLQTPSDEIPEPATGIVEEDGTPDKPSGLLSNSDLDEFSELKAQISDDLCPFEDSDITTPAEEPGTGIDDDLSDVLRELEQFELHKQRINESVPLEEITLPDELAIEELPEIDPLQSAIASEHTDSQEEKTPGLQDQLLREEILGRPKPAKKSGGLWWSLGILALLLVALSQFIWFGRVKLMHYPESRMLLQGTCQILGCQLPTIRAPEQIQVLSRSISSHPKVENALLIQLTIANKANFSQPHPMLQISLFSSEELLVVQRRFLPDEYLSDHSQSDRLDPGKALYVELEIQDPGSDVTGFKLEFF